MRLALRSAWIWAVAILLALFWWTLPGQRGDPVPLILQFLGMGVLFTLAYGRLAVIRHIVMVLLLIMTALATFDFTVGTFVWINPSRSGSLEILRNWIDAGIARRGFRTWYIAPGADSVDVSLRVQANYPLPTRDWFRSDSRFVLVEKKDDHGAWTRIVTPVGGNPYLMRTWEGDRALGGRTFRVRVTARSATSSVQLAECRGLWLQTFDRDVEHRTCLNLPLEPDWRTYETTWAVPASVTSSRLRIALNELDGVTYDLRDVRVWEDVNGEWLPLTTLLPTVPYLDVRWSGPNREVHIRRSLDVGDVTSLHLTDPVKEHASASSLLRVGLYSSENEDLRRPLQVLATRVTAFGGGDVRAAVPTPPAIRSRLVFDHPNLAAHTALILGSVAVALTMGWKRNLALALTFTIIAATGSRSALLGLLVLVSFLPIRSAMGRFRWRHLAATGLAAVIVIVLLSSGALVHLREGENEFPRGEIWRTALAAWATHPVAGLGYVPDAFTTYWVETHPRSTSMPVTHAHNFWLHLASLMGTPGLVIAFWVTGGVVRFALRFGGRRGAMITFPVIIVNLFDTSLFFTGVFLPWIAGVAAIAGGAEDDGRTPPQAIDGTTDS